MTTTTRNITHTTIMVVEERQLISGLDEVRTRIQTEAEITCNLTTGGRFLRNRVEAFGVQRFEKNIGKSRRGLSWVLDNLERSDDSDTTTSQLGGTGRPRSLLMKGLADRVVRAKERVGDRVERAKERVGEKVERAAERVNERVDKVLPKEGAGACGDR